MSELNCIKCESLLTEETRYVTKTKRYNQCISCRRKYAREYTKKNRKDVCTSETCFKCNKNFNEVARWKNNQCLECYREYQRVYQNKRRANPKPVDLNDREQQCFKCNTTFNSENRYKTTNQCIECYRQLTHTWYEDNKSEIRKKFNERYASDDKFKEYRNYKKTIWKIITGKQKSSKYINFNPKEMFDWLEYSCTNYDLTFSHINDGTLIVDHVIPLDKGLKGSVDWGLVIGWWNMSPLKPNENLVKNSRLDVDQLVKHHACLMRYTRERNIVNPSIEVYLNHLQDTSQCRETRKASNTTRPLETLGDTQGNDLGHGNSVEDDEISASLGAMSLKSAIRG